MVSIISVSLRRLGYNLYCQNEGVKEGLPFGAFRLLEISPSNRNAPKDKASKNSSLTARN